MPQARKSPAAVVAAILHEAFASSPSNVSRSCEFRAGAEARLLQLLIGKPFACPYVDGTCRANAFFFGAEEGTRLFHANELQKRSTKAHDPYAGLKGHDYIIARNLAQPVRRNVQTSAHNSLSAREEACK